MGDERIQKTLPVRDANRAYSTASCGVSDSTGGARGAESTRLSPRSADSVGCNEAHVAQLAEAPDSNPGKCAFESHRGHSRIADALLVGTVTTLLIVVALWMPPIADAAQPGRHLTIGCGVHASVVDRRACIIRRVFGPRHAPKAVRVAWCESRLDPRAVNGQYLGVFQMGRRERARFGHSGTVLGQALAARRYFRVSGWSPWSCA